VTDAAPATTLARAGSSVGEVALRRRGAHTELVVGGVFVMDTVDVSTEVALATVALGRHDAPRRVLIGGLGLGFTATAVLADQRVEEVLVVEIAEPLIDWAGAGLLPTDLVDPRIHLRAGDVVEVLTATPGEWDLILLDVDNGPGFLVREDNARLYGPAGLSSAVAALAPSGVLAIWSSHPAPELLAALDSIEGGTAQEVLRRVSREGRDLTYGIYLLEAAAQADADLVQHHPRE